MGIVSHGISWPGNQDQLGAIHQPIMPPPWSPSKSSEHGGSGELPTAGEPHAHGHTSVVTSSEESPDFTGREPWDLCICHYSQTLPWVSLPLAASNLCPFLVINRCCEYNSFQCALWALLATYQTWGCLGGTAPPQTCRCCQKSVLELVAVP